MSGVSADGGWALAFRRNPASAGPDPVLLVRTGDGGRTWADVTPGRRTGDARHAGCGTWAAVPQGRHFTQLGASVNFANARDGVEWTEAGDAQGAVPPPLYATSDSGRTWTSFAPEVTG